MKKLPLLLTGGLMLAGMASCVTHDKHQNK